MPVGAPGSAAGRPVLGARGADSTVVTPPSATSPFSAASSALARDSSICLRCASKRARASAYCRSHSSRCESKPGSQSPVSESKPSGYR